MRNQVTGKQVRVLERLRKGVKIEAYRNKNGAWCFSSDADGLRGVLYLTLTCRALVRKRLAFELNGELCLTPARQWAKVS